MTTFIIRFLNSFLAALLVGTMFGIWIGQNPFSLSPAAYIEQQQNTIHQLNVLMPILGLITILTTLIAAFLLKKSKPVLIALLAAAAFLIISGLVTRFGNQPINSVILTWATDSPPENWIEFRDKWWALHILRTITGLVALSLIIWTNTRTEIK